jgi:hypothetical protein
MMPVAVVSFPLSGISRSRVAHALACSMFGLFMWLIV